MEPHDHRSSFLRLWDREQMLQRLSQSSKEAEPREPENSVHSHRRRGEDESTADSAKRQRIPQYPDGHYAPLPHEDALAANMMRRQRIPPPFPDGPTFPPSAQDDLAGASMLKHRVPQYPAGAAFPPHPHNRDMYRSQWPMPDFWPPYSARGPAESVGRPLPSLPSDAMDRAQLSDGLYHGAPFYEKMWYPPQWPGPGTGPPSLGPGGRALSQMPPAPSIPPGWGAIGARPLPPPFPTNHVQEVFPSLIDRRRGDLSAPDGIVSSSDTDDTTIRDMRRLACAIVDYSLINGRLPCFGSEAEKLILDLDAEQALVQKLLSESEVKSWQDFIKSNDPETTIIRYKSRSGKKNSSAFRALLGTKISEHWSYKSKTLLRSIKPKQELSRKELKSGKICKQVADWLKVPVEELKPRAMALVFWRVNKHIRGTNLRKELTAARSTTGSGVRGGHKIAREQWLQELEDEYKTLFPDEEDLEWLNRGIEAAGEL